MDYLKDAFSKVKQDIDSLKIEITSLKQNYSTLNETSIELCEIIQDLNKKIADISLNLKINSDYKENVVPKTTPTQDQLNKTIPTHTPTHDSLFKPLKDQKYTLSIGNEGVPTDRQTDRQTDQQIDFTHKIFKKTDSNTLINPPKTKEPIFYKTKIQDNNLFKDANSLLDSLDKIKKEIRIKFKKLTDQEMSVFSTLYHLEEETGYCDYKLIANKLNLTESSIRDYVGKLIKKEIPIEKKKINNKTINLSISQNLKKIAQLSTIIQLREL